MYNSGVPSPEAVDELHHQPNPAPTIHPLPTTGQTDITNEQLKLFTILSIFRIYSSITKKIIQILRHFTTELGGIFFYLL